MDINQVYCAATTPIQNDNQIDFKGFEANIEWYIKSGLKGILVCGGTGEFVSLSTQERLLLTEFAADKINGRCGFMVGCAAETTAEAVQYAKHARDLGADGILLIASYYFKPSEEEAFRHFKAVAESVDTPIVLYNNPGSCGTDLKPALVRRLIEIPNISHIKEATGDLLRFRELLETCGEGLNVLCGCDALAYELFQNGAKGWISITANALAAQSQALFDQMQQGNDREAWALYHRYLPLYTICEQPYKAIQTIKHMLDRIGCCGGASRLPRLELTDSEKAHVDGLMKKAGLI